MDGYFRIMSGLTHAGACGAVATSNGELVTDESILDPFAHYATAWDGFEGPFGDFLSPLSNPMVVSERAAALIQKFALPPQTVFGRVHLHTELGGSHLGSAMMILFRAGTFELMDPEDAAADERRSFHDRAHGIGPPPTIVRNATGGYDLLRGYHVLNICSARLKSAIESAGFTNCEFIPIAVK